MPTVGSVATAQSDSIAQGPTKRTHAGASVRTSDFSGVVDRPGPGDGTSGGFEEEGIPFPVPVSTSGSKDRSDGQILSDNDEGPLVIGPNYDGFGFLDTFRSGDIDDDGDEEVFGIFPSDAQIGTGTDKHVSVVNSELGIFDKESGEREFEVRLEDWFENVRSQPPGGFFALDGFLVFDPYVRYDTATDRYLVACVEFNFDANEGAWLLSVSDDGDPFGTWTNYRIPPLDNEGLVDFPKLGFDANAVYLTQNFFAVTASGGFRFDGVTLAILDKTDLLAGQTVNAWHFTDLRNPGGGRAFAVQPASMPGHDGPFSLLNSITSHPHKGLTLWEVSDPTGDPSITNRTVDVGAYEFPPDGRQPDTEEQISTIGLLLENVAFDSQAGTLWTAHSIRDGTVQWYEIDPLAGNVVQQGIFKRKGLSTFFPAIETNSESTVMVYNVSGKQDFPRVEAAGRTSDFEKGRIEAFDIVKEGESKYDLQVDNPNTPQNEDAGIRVERWGDYNGISVDPDGQSYWVISQYASDPENHDRYTTRIAQVTV